MGRSFRRITLGLFFVVGALVIVVVRVAYHHYQAVAYDFAPNPPTAALLQPERLHIPNLEEIKIDLKDGSLSGWYVPSFNHAAVVITHGTNSDRTSMLAEFRLLADAGFGVLAFDWPGCGLSSGSAHWNEQERQALGAAITWLQARSDVDPAKIGGLGFSIGSYIMAQVSARDQRIRAVVLEGTPTGYRDAIEWQNRKWGELSEIPARWALKKYGFMNGELRPLDSIAQIAPRPLLLVTGDKDDEIPPFMARTLFAAAGSPKSIYVVSGAGHENYSQIGGKAYQIKIVEFFTAGLLSN